MPTPKGTKPWNAGTSKGWSDKRGYRWIYVTENGRRRAKREHRHIMEEHLGRRLTPEEVVHHRNEDPSDNRIENLEVKPFGLHTADHHKGTKHAEQSKITQSVFAEYREENKRLNNLKDDLLEAIRSLIAEETVLVHVGYDERQNFIYADAVRTDSEAFDLARAAISKATTPTT